MEGASKEAGEILPDVVEDSACGHDGLAVAMPSPDYALRSREPSSQRQRYRRAYAALDLGTNNCRLLVAHPRPRGFKVIGAFSRIIRLGRAFPSVGGCRRPPSSAPSMPYTPVPTKCARSTSSGRG